MKPTKEYPTDQTLEKYGLSRDEFKAILKSQDNTCPICEKTPSTGRWNIDHHHVKGWSKMPPEQRKLYVRGVVCWFCNRYYMSKAISIRKAENVAEYLRRYEKRNLSASG